MLFVPLLLQLVTAAPATLPDTASIEAALVAAVRARIGDDAEVEVDDLQVPPSLLGVPVYARLDPGARLGRTVHFNLAKMDGGSAPPVFAASARAAIRVVVPHLHTRRPVARGDDLTDDNVVLVEHAIEAGAFEPRPGAEVIGASRAARQLAADACLTRTSLVMLPAVQAGQEVDAIARVNGVEAVARLVAAERGQIGSLVRVVNPQSRRSLKARVVAAGVVEVIQ